MPVVKKEIVADKTYTANSKNGRIRRAFTPDYQNRLINTSNSMIGSGLRIPAPFGHSKAAKPQTEIELNQGTPQSSFNNAGYWSFFTQEPNEEGKPAIFGYIDLPGSETETDSAYYKAKNSAKEVSISVHDEYEDGLQRKWKDAIMHVALVNHPAAPGTSDWQDAPEGALIMSAMDDEGPEYTYDLGVVTALKTAAATYGIVLPADCSPKTILRDLLVAFSQKSPGSGLEMAPVPIYMSATTSGDDSMALTLEQATALVATKTMNPTTKSPFTMEDLGFKAAPAPQTADMSALQVELSAMKTENAKLSSLVKAIATTATTNIKNTIQNRLNALKERGLPASVVESLQPQVEFQMSLLADGSAAPHPLEITLSTLEQSLPAPTVKTLDPLRGTYIPPNPNAGPQDLSDTEINTLLDDVLRQV
jgi:hypothetical protein